MTESQLDLFDGEGRRPLAAHVWLKETNGFYVEPSWVSERLFAVEDIGVHAERYPLSGASRFRGSGHDLDLYPFGREEAPIVAECKARKNGSGFVQLEAWLGDYDALFLRRNNAEPLVLLPWRVWAALLSKVRRGGAS
jgi:hypothetical protein